MKKVLFISVLAIILLQSCGMLFFFQIQQNLIQDKMQISLINPGNKFENLKLSLSNYKNSKISSHEILFNEIMYDVKSVKISGDIVLLAVLADNAESGLVQKIQNYFGINNKHESKIPEKFNKLFSLIYIIPTLNFTVLLNRINQNLFFSFSENIVCNYSDIIILPPKKI